jgi:hypothetical protein
MLDFWGFRQELRSEVNTIPVPVSVVKPVQMLIIPKLTLSFLAEGVHQI